MEGSDDMTHIGIKIKARREQLGMSQDELAEKMGYKSRSTIAKIEKGVNDVYQGNIVKFAEVLNTSIAYLMSWDEEAINAISSAHDESMEDLASLDAEIALDKEERNMIQENRKKLLDGLGDDIFSDDEINQITDFAKFLISKRKDE